MTLYLIQRYLLAIIIVISFCDCSKLLDVDTPTTNINEDNVYEDDATAIAVLTGIYANMSKGGLFTGASSMSLESGLSADELTLYNQSTDSKLIGYYKNELISNSTLSIGTDAWALPYNIIFTTNAILEKLPVSSQLSPSVKQQLIGEAKFIRAFCYFYLVNLFGDVPLPLVTDPEVTRKLSRSSSIDVYNQIISDLKDAEELLSADFLNEKLGKYSTITSAERVRPTKWAASIMLARTYLFTNDFIEAEAEANKVINNKAVFDTVPINNVFLKNSMEAIWQLQPVIKGHNTEDAWVFIIPSTGLGGGVNNNNYPVYLSSLLLSSFELGDKRRVLNNWVKSITINGTVYYYPFKYKSATLNAPVTEYVMMLRLSELYLIRAEARAQQNDIVGSLADINIIRTRAGLPNKTSNDKNALLADILHERQVELFTENGHRWLDLKRSNNIDNVMSLVTPQKGGSQWQSYKKLYPIPSGDVEKAPNVTQNFGYY